MVWVSKTTSSLLIFQTPLSVAAAQSKHISYMQSVLAVSISDCPPPWYPRWCRPLRPLSPGWPRRITPPGLNQT